MSQHFYHQAKFLTSAPSLRESPVDSGFEVAFAGRSNAGKSSALNVITGQKSLARTSKQPGRTRLLNFFSLDDERKLVDLPGYGYAKAPAKMRKEWAKALESYIETRNSLCGVMVLMDIRHPLTEIDQQMLLWSSHFGLKIHILLTKSDKLKKGAANNTLYKVRSLVEEEYENISVQLFSSTAKTGLTEVWSKLDQWFERV